MEMTTMTMLPCFRAFVIFGLIAHENCLLTEWCNQIHFFHTLRMSTWNSNNMASSAFDVKK